jgi:putative transposase
MLSIGSGLTALSQASGTIGCVKWSNVAGDDAGQVLMSHTGHRLSRAVAFQFTLDPNRAQVQDFFRCAGAARFTFNHHIASVKANLTCRAHQRAMGMPAEAMTPSLSWSVQSQINEFNAWKNGRHALSPTNDDGTRGLAWRTEVPADVFECASVDSARALGNYSASAKGARAGVRVGFPRFKARAKTAPSFRLRSKSKPGATAPVRFIDAKHLRLGKLGPVRVHGSTRRVRRMHTAGRFHIHSVTVTLNGGRWVASVAGVAAELHHQHRRRSHASRPKPHRYVGADFGIKSLVVAADSDGSEVRVWEGVNALHTAQLRLRRANKTLSRTKPGSAGRAQAIARLQKLHARVARIRRHLAHDITTWLVTNCDRIVVEDLNVSGMGRLRTLARAIADAGLGDLRRLLEYKAAWYGIEFVVADRWFPSSKTCSRCGEVKDTLLLSERTYRCEACGLEIDRDLNAAVNLARWPDRPVTTGSPPLAAAA